jgi:hypothetical protein
MVASDDHGASACLFPFLDEISTFDTFFPVHLSEVLGQLVISNTTCVHN